MPQERFAVVHSRASISALSRQLSQEKKSIGFVPTMGALHNGHLSLIRLAREQADVVVASIFVNPTQFAPGEDFDTYPRDEAADLAQLEAAGCNVAYCPDLKDMYPAGSVTDVRVPGLSDGLDGVYRPHFFYGVTTVVARLFLHVWPDVAVFGEKDFQQLQIIRRMVNDLGFPVKVVGAPTIRDADGLAQSSRNLYLSDGERRRAGALHAALHRARMRIISGTPPEVAEAEAGDFLARAGFTSVDYIRAVASESLEPLGVDRAGWPAQMRILGAAWMGKTRLIDNLPLSMVGEDPGD